MPVSDVTIFECTIFLPAASTYLSSTWRYSQPVWCIAGEGRTNLKSSEAWVALLSLSNFGLGFSASSWYCGSLVDWVIGIGLVTWDFDFIFLPDALLQILSDPSHVVVQKELLCDKNDGWRERLLGQNAGGKKQNERRLDLIGELTQPWVKLHWLGELCRPWHNNGMRK